MKHMCLYYIYTAHHNGMRLENLELRDAFQTCCISHSPCTDQIWLAPLIRDAPHTYASRIFKLFEAHSHHMRHEYLRWARGW